MYTFSCQLSSKWQTVKKGSAVKTHPSRKMKCGCSAGGHRLTHVSVSCTCRSGQIPQQSDGAVLKRRIGRLHQWTDVVQTVQLVYNCMTQHIWYLTTKQDRKHTHIYEECSQQHTIKYNCLHEFDWHPYSTHPSGLRLARLQHVSETHTDMCKMIRIYNGWKTDPSNVFSRCFQKADFFQISRSLANAFQTYCRWANCVLQM